MLRLLLSGVFALSVLAQSQGRRMDYPEGYWDREFGVGYQMVPTYTMAIEPVDAEKATARIDALMKAAGASLTSLNSMNRNYGGSSAIYGGASPLKTIVYHAPVEAAEEAAKKVMELGVLRQYNAQRQGQASQTDELKDRIEQLERELRENAPALEGMPAAKALLNSRLKRLKASAEALKGTDRKAMIQVTLLGQPAPGAQDEGAAKGNLGAVRSALSIFYGDLEGRYPSDLSELTLNGKYLSAIPSIEVGGHKRTSSYRVIRSAAGNIDGLIPQLKDTGGWAFVSSPGSSQNGTVVIDCTHTDSRGMQWFRY